MRNKAEALLEVDLHTRQQTIAMLDPETVALVEKTLKHEGETVREFYSALPYPVVVGIEATGSMYWFLELLEELGLSVKWVIRQRSARLNPGNRSMIGGMRHCY